MQLRFLLIYIYFSWQHSSIIIITIIINNCSTDRVIDVLTYLFSGQHIIIIIILVSFTTSTSTVNFKSATMLSHGGAGGESDLIWLLIWLLTWRTTSLTNNRTDDANQQLPTLADLSSPTGSSDLALLVALNLLYLRLFACCFTLSLLCLLLNFELAWLVASLLALLYLLLHFGPALLVASLLAPTILPHRWRQHPATQVAPATCSAYGPLVLPPSTYKCNLPC
jgi:hypothetical protein